MSPIVAAPTVTHAAESPMLPASNTPSVLAASLQARG